MTEKWGIIASKIIRRKSWKYRLSCCIYKKPSNCKRQHVKAFILARLPYPSWSQEVQLWLAVHDKTADVKPGK